MGEMIPVLDFGGNAVRAFGPKLPASTVLADDAYHYEIVCLEPGERRAFLMLTTGAAWLLESKSGVSVHHPAGDAVWPADAALLFDGEGLEIEAGKSRAVLLIAGTAAGSGEPARCEIQSRDQLKRVVKPWGEEIWINGRHPTFAFKRIVLNAGNRTSLQYHEFKRETNLLLAGSSRLHYNEIAGTHHGPYDSAAFDAVVVIDVTPGILHRIEAMTDVTLFEVSTPHLDDVIRISDDTNRADGVIASEHEMGTSCR